MTVKRPPLTGTAAPNTIAVTTRAFCYAKTASISPLLQHPTVPVSPSKRQEQPSHFHNVSRLQVPPETVKRQAECFLSELAGDQPFESEDLPNRIAKPPHALRATQDKTAPTRGFSLSIGDPVFGVVGEAYQK